MIFVTNESRSRTGPILAGGLFVLVAVGLVVVIVWFYERGPATGSSGASARRTLSLIISGDTAGWITPCGCASGQSGGLARRGTFVSSVEKESDVILMDIGGAPGGTSPYQRVKFEAILKGELAMGLAAHNLGGAELKLGVDSLRAIQKRLNVPFLSANARTPNGDVIVQPCRIVKAAGRRALVVGVVSQQYATSDVQIGDPKESVLATMQSVNEPYDWLVVLAYLPETELRDLARGLPEAHVIVGGPTGQSITPTRVGPVLLAAATNKGKFLVHLKHSPSGDSPPPADRLAGGKSRNARVRPRAGQPQAQTSLGGWTGRVVELTADLPDDSTQTDNLKHYYAELGRRDFAAPETGFAPQLPGNLPMDYRVAGTQSCRSCHGNDCRLWEQSRHAHAWEPLIDKGAHVDAYCQQCHTTGFGLPGGFVSAARRGERTSVGCESCHGPSLAHGRTPRSRTPFAAQDQCVRCHDRENSPQFDYASYWQRIVHGQEPASERPRKSRSVKESIIE